MPRPASAAAPGPAAQRCRWRRASCQTAAKRARAAAGTGAGSPTSGPSSRRRWPSTRCCAPSPATSSSCSRSCCAAWTWARCSTTRCRTTSPSARWRSACRPAAWPRWCSAPSSAAGAPQLIMFTVLAIAPLVTAVCAWGFGLWAAVVVEFTAIFCASLAKLAQDSIVGREIGDEIRSSTFSVSETLNQVANVAGGLAGVVVSILDNGQAGLAIAAGALVVALVLLVVRRRQRVRVRRRADVPAARAVRREPLRARCPWRRPSAALRSAWLPSAPGACRAGRRPRSRRAASSGPR